jgi:integrase
MASKGRRGNREGSLTKRPDGRWEARITLDNGKRKSFFARTRQEAARRLTEALRDYEKGLPIVGDKQTLRTYLAEWLEIIRPALRESSWQRYEEICRLHLIPQLGGTSLSRLSAQQLNRLYTQKLADGLSPQMVRYIHVTAHKAMQNALHVGLVQRNVASFATAPRKQRRKMQVFNAEQARAFLEAVRGDPFEALYVLAITCAMRLGELLALQWSDVDVEAGHLQVRTSVRKRRGRFAFNEPKTDHGRRKLALTRLAQVALRTHRVRQEGERLAAGPSWNQTDLVFCNKVGLPLDGISVLRYRYAPLVKSAGLPRIRFHDLRHTCATLMLLAGVHPKVVSEMLGHASITITLDLYSHVLPDMQREATSALDELLHPRVTNEDDRSTWS